MIKPTTKTIGDREYRFMPPGFDEWLELTSAIAVISGPVADVMARLHAEQAVPIGDSVQRVASELLKASRAGLLDKVCAGLAFNAKPTSRTAKKDAKKDSWTSLANSKARDIWRGSYLEGLLCIRWVLEVTYAGFWTAGTGLAPELYALLGMPAPGQAEGSTPES